MSLFKVHATQEQEMVFFVEAPDWETAKKDAESLVDNSDSSDWVHTDTTVWTHKAQDHYQPDKWDSIWTGGPQGTWIIGDELEGR